MHQKLGFAVLLLLQLEAGSQPYLDLLNIRYSNSPDAGMFNQHKTPVRLQYFNLSITLPLVFRNNDAVVVSPFFESWRIRSGNANQRYYGVVLPVSLLKNFNGQWSILATGIIRMNDSAFSSKMKRQAGAALIVNYKKNGSVTYKAGVYLNDEFFGLFGMPLFGVDWQINKKNELFGVLPGNITFQHRSSSSLAYGIVFRAQTNSYNRSNDAFIRIDENQLGAFADYYVTKKVVINLETGHSLFRKLRSKKRDDCGCKLNYYDYKVNDNMYLKISLAYRLPLRE